MKDYTNYYYQKMPDEISYIYIAKFQQAKRGKGISTHWHEHMQFFYFTHGKALVKCNSVNIPVTSGDLVIINCNELHYCKSLCSDLSYYIIRIDLSFLFSSKIDSCQTKYMTPLAQNLILFKNLVRNDNDASKCINKIIEEYFTKNIGFELAIKSYIYELIVILIRKYVKKILTKKEFDFQYNNLKRFKKIINYIETNYTSQISITSLSSMGNMSRYHFCRLFKQITGKSAIDYINGLRIEKAAELLLESSCNITEIALSCGFNDTNYFSRVFKKYKHISPTQMRKK